MLHRQNNPNVNFFPYFLTLILALADPNSSNKQKYLQKYKLDKIMPKNLLPHRLFYYKIQKIIGDFTAL